jgi:hypothetical protein
VTQADAPEPPPPAAQIDPDARSERARSLKIAHLRTHARARCRARVQHLQAELASIGQLVRLVHEQTLARDVRHGELAKILTAVLEEAEVARQARDEVEAIVAEPVPIGLLSLPRAGQG